MKGPFGEKQIQRSAQLLVPNLSNTATNKTILQYELDCALLTQRLHPLPVRMKGCILWLLDSKTIYRAEKYQHGFIFAHQLI